MKPHLTALEGSGCHISPLQIVVVPSQQQQWKLTSFLVTYQIATIMTNFHSRFPIIITSRIPAPAYQWFLVPSHILMGNCIFNHVLFFTVNNDQRQSVCMKPSEASCLRYSCKCCTFWTGQMLERCSGDTVTAQVVQHRNCVSWGFSMAQRAKV